MTRGDGPESTKTVLVGISNPDTADQLVGLAAALAAATPLQVLLTHVVTVANQISLTTGQSSPEVLRARDFLGRVVGVAREGGVESRALVEVARSVQEGLLAAAVSHDAAMILVGYSDSGDGDDERGDDEERFDRTMHRVARKASSDVVVAKFRRDEHRRIAVPLTTTAPLRLTGLLCRALTKGDGAEVTFLHVADPDTEADQARKELTSRLDEADLADLGALRVMTSDDPVEAIVEEVADHDMVVLGPSGRPGILERLFSGRARKIAESVSGSVVLAWASAEDANEAR